jgi:formylglycine-generating enzyme required for sulfatase activity
MTSTTPLELSPEIKSAGRKIVEFVRKYDPLYLSLACHAAFPLVLTPELLYQIWAEFVNEAPWVSVAHLWLSPLCQEVSYEMFEMELNIRNLLLEELIAQEGKERLTQLGNFMLAYLEQRLVGGDADTQNLNERETITALAYTQPTEAARRLAQKLTAGVHTTDVREAFHWTTLAKTLANPLRDAGFEPLLTYNDILFHYAQGNIAQHQGLVSKFRQEKPDIEGRLGINLSLPQGVQTDVVQESVPLSVSESYENKVLEPPPLSIFTAETVYVDRRGKIVTRETINVPYYDESLTRINVPYYDEPLTREIEPIRMMAIPQGEFWMGSPESEKGHVSMESPQHLVKVPAFFMSQTPITQAQWKAITYLPEEGKRLEPDPSNFKGDDLPVENVRWQDAIEFCARLSRASGRKYRLPSEAEWEYACRGIANQVAKKSNQKPVYPPFHFGETLTSNLANYRATEIYQQEVKGECREKTTPVRSFPPNAFGLYDMHGNVWEWCLDPMDENYERARALGDGKVWDEKDNDNRYYDILSNINVLIEDGRIHVSRGGCWNFGPRDCRSAYCYDFDVDAFYIAGFRPALSV